MTRYTGLIALAFSLYACNSFAQGKEQWVDSTLRSMSKKERIAQLFFLRAHTDKGKAYEDTVGKMVKKLKVGGLVFFQGGPYRQAALTERYQQLAKTPLLIAMDAEWGLGMRLDSTISFPYQLSLGAIQDNKLIYQMGRAIAKDFKIMGMQLNFAPVSDINNNPRNPVINYRSFGDNKYNVAEKALAYMKGMQDGGILTSIKHFPGHGDTEVDSHKDLPQLKFSRERLDSLEMYPFKRLIDAGASGVMVAHMNIPTLDNTPNLPSTLSARIIRGILKDSLNFKGLVMSDAMEMKGVVKFFPEGQADVMAVKAGNDIVELSEDTRRAIKLIRKSVRKHEIGMAAIDSSARKILAAKYDAGLQAPFRPALNTLTADLNRQESKDLVQQLADASATVLLGDSAIRKLDPSRKTAIISLGVASPTTFQQELKKAFPNSMNFLVSKIASLTDINSMVAELKAYDQVIVAIHDYRKRPQSNLDVNTNMKLLIAALSKLNTVTCLFANPYTLAGLPGVESSKSLLVMYQNNEEQQKAAVKVLSKKSMPNGRLPVSINSFFRNGDGITM